MFSPRNSGRCGINSNALYSCLKLIQSLAVGLVFAAVLNIEAAWLASPVSAQTVTSALPSVVSVLPEWPPDRRRVEEPEGSGVVVADGHFIVTSAHIVAKARSVRIRTFDGILLAARLVGVDLVTDIALLKIDDALTPVTIVLEDPNVGEPVCAVGNAFGLGLSVTCGVVSAVNKAGLKFNPIEDFVQTDAAVNPGASGGALVSPEGKMVGLLSAIYTKQTDANIGVNFAVSSVLVSRVITMLRDNGRAKWVRSGLRLVTAPNKGEIGKLAARVVRIVENSPAAQAGFIVNDLIWRAGGRRIRKPADFTSILARHMSGSTMDVMIVRNGAVEKLTLKLN